VHFLAPGGELEGTGLCNGRHQGGVAWAVAHPQHDRITSLLAAEGCVTS
jgi:hypothetical protein